MRIHKIFIPLALTAACHAIGSPIGVIIPAYFYPSGAGLSDWQVTIADAKRVPTIIILNPNSGPSSTSDATYTHEIALMHQAGGKVVGYIATGYGKHSLQSLYRQVDLYRKEYHIDGIFFDEMDNSGTPKSLAFYAALDKYVKRSITKSLVVGNPGTNIPKAYTSHADILMDYESPLAEFKKYHPDDWARFLGKKSSYIVYDVPSAGLSEVLRTAASYGAHWVYISELKGDNPYLALPKYWEAEISWIEKYNRTHKNH